MSQRAVAFSVAALTIGLGVGAIVWLYGGAGSRAASAVAGMMCPPAAKTANLFTTEKDRASTMLGKWLPGKSNLEQPKELDNFVFWELIPGIFEVGQDSFRNLLDALPQTATYAQKDGRRMYSLSTIISATYNTTKKDNGVKVCGWMGTPPNPGPRDCNEKPSGHTEKCLFEDSLATDDSVEVRRLQNLRGGLPNPQASPNIHIMRMRGRTISMSGAGGWTELVRDASTGTVSTAEVTKFEDDLEHTLLHECNFSPHSIFDAERKEHVGAMLCVGILPHTPLSPMIKIWTMAEDPAATKAPMSLKRELVAQIPTTLLFDLHSFGLSEKHVVVVESSPKFQSSVLIAHSIKGDLQMLKTMCDWQDEKAQPAASLIVVERKTGTYARYKIDGPVGKVEHFAGSFDLPNGSTVVDFLAEAPGNAPAFSLSAELSRLLYHTNESAALLNQWFVRCVVPPPSLSSAASATRAYCRRIGGDIQFGPFVTMNPNFYKKHYKFAYLTYPNKSEALGLSDGVVKLDIELGRVVASSYASFPAGRYVVNEPRFVPRGEAEDDALLVVTMHDTAKDRSFQAVYDTKDMSLLGTFDFGDPDDAKSAGRMRVAFHGMHCPADSQGPCLRL